MRDPTLAAILNAILPGVGQSSITVASWPAFCGSLSRRASGSVRAACSAGYAT